MTNRPKNIGTAFETLVVNYARENGFPQADRLALSGSADRGDVRLTADLQYGAIAECKGGQAAERASDAQILQWLHDTEVERINANAHVALLVVKRKGHGKTKVGGMDAYLWLDMDDDGMGLAMLGFRGVPRHQKAIVPVRLRLDDALLLLRTMGHGESLS